MSVVFITTLFLMFQRMSLAFILLLFSFCLVALLKNKIQPSKCEDLIDFINQFMNQPVSHLASRDTPRSDTNARLL